MECLCLLLLVASRQLIYLINLPPLQILSIWWHGNLKTSVVLSQTWSLWGNTKSGWKEEVPFKRCHLKASNISTDPQHYTHIYCIFRRNNYKKKTKKKKPCYLEHQFTVISPNKYHLPREPMANASAAHQEPRSHAHFGAWHLTFIHPKHKKTHKTQLAINEVCKYKSL